MTRTMKRTMIMMVLLLVCCAYATPATPAPPTPEPPPLDEYLADLDWIIQARVATMETLSAVVLDYRDNPIYYNDPRWQIVIKATLFDWEQVLRWSAELNAPPVAETLHREVVTAFTYDELAREAAIAWIEDSDDIQLAIMESLIGQADDRLQVVAAIRRVLERQQGIDAASVDSGEEE